MGVPSRSPASMTMGNHHRSRCARRRHNREGCPGLGDARLRCFQVLASGTALKRPASARCRLQTRCRPAHCESRGLIRATEWHTCGTRAARQRASSLTQLAASSSFLADASTAIIDPTRPERRQLAHVHSDGSTRQVPMARCAWQPRAVQARRGVHADTIELARWLAEISRMQDPRRAPELTTAELEEARRSKRRAPDWRSHATGSLRNHIPPGGAFAVMRMPMCLTAAVR